ncbi:hypothetical protein A8L34_06285 [Bacillus sp. FJAT-27264]|nr:hypothetical protein A8L34_06285 [Bacillus sp. FJAT-27264]
MIFMIAMNQFFSEFFFKMTSCVLVDFNDDFFGPANVTFSPIITIAYTALYERLLSTWHHYHLGFIMSDQTFSYAIHRFQLIPERY